MMQVLRSLDSIATGYSVFEKDQVLTHDQLNTLASYLDDQERLTRIGLFGVGVACGLRVSASLTDNRVALTKGVGVTTDGDLLLISTDTVFDRFKKYDESAPMYAPFFVNDKMLPMFELVGAGVTDAQGVGLGQFLAQTTRKLEDMVALLFVESYVKDEDLCSGTDCDNLGKDSVNNIKLLLLDKASASSLLEKVSTLDRAAGRLAPIVADRPLTPAAIGTLKALAASYRAACGSINKKLTDALSSVYKECSALLADLFPSDPAPGWIARLNAASATFGGTDVGIQYYYDFLKDVVDTYNAFRERLFGDTAVCCPDVTAFPKYLLLGNLTGGIASTENRTGFYPSLMMSANADRRAHARSLASKLHTLMNTFKVPPGGLAQPIGITPSLFEDRSLEERAIPYYYDVNTALPIHQAWSYALTRRGLERNNYSYNAARYQAQGAAASPLTAQIGGFPFFRIEGHLGREVTGTVKFFEDEIAGKNLPFAVRSVMIGADTTKVVKPPIRYTDLHRLHYMIRQDLSSQLDDAVRFSGNFKLQVDEAVKANVVTNNASDNDGSPVMDTATQKDAAVSAKAITAKSKLNRSYTDYKADASWKSDIKDTVTAAGEFKYNLGKVVKTEFVTPFDSLISNSQLQWADWLDQIIKVKDDKEDDKLLFANFIARHPAAEHFGGVVRGGTFVLVYDATRTVVADFMLPYWWADQSEPQPDEPPLPRPDVKPGFVLDKGIRVIPSLDNVITGKLVDFRTKELDPALKASADFQKTYVQTVKDSVDVLGKAFTPTKVTDPVRGGPKVADPLLDIKIRDTVAKGETVDTLRQILLDPGTDAATRTATETQLKSAEGDLAKAASDTTQYVATSKQDVKAGTDAFAAMTVVSDSVSKLTDAAALKSVQKDLTTVQNSTTVNPNLKLVIGNTLKAKGLG